MHHYLKKPINSREYFTHLNYTSGRPGDADVYVRSFNIAGTNWKGRDIEHLTIIATRSPQTTQFVPKTEILIDIIKSVYTRYYGTEVPTINSTSDAKNELCTRISEYMKRCGYDIPNIYSCIDEVVFPCETNNTTTEQTIPYQKVIS